MSRFISASDVAREQIPIGSLGWISRPDITGARDLIVIEVTLLPGHGHSFHRHPDQEEVIYVIEGRIEQWLERDHRILGAGDSVFVAKDVVHASFNTSSKAATFIAILGPSVTDAGYVAVDVSEEGPWKNLRA